MTFEVGIASLGGIVHLSRSHGHASRRARIHPRHREKSRALGARNRGARFRAGIARRAGGERRRIPVINALSDRFHPCQALADFFTLEERFGDLRGLKLAYVGDGNNMCHSLLSIGARVGAHVRVATPAGYEPDADIVAEAKRVARETRGKIEILRSPEEAVAGAQAVYTDVWASMGQEEEAAAREAAFAGYQVNEALFSQAAPDAVFMHCLPAHRGLEVTEARHGFAALHRLRSGGKSPARPKSDSAHAAQLISAANKENALPKKVVLAYSGGLDTSIIIPWLKETYPAAK